MGHPQPYFRLFWSFSNCRINPNLATNQCKNFHQVYSAWIQTHYLQTVSLLPQQLDQDSCKSILHIKKSLMGGSSGLVVVGDDSYSRGRGFKCRRYMLDGHDIFHIHLLQKVFCFF